MANDAMLIDESENTETLAQLQSRHGLEIHESDIMGTDAPHDCLAAVLLIDELNGSAKPGDRVIINPWMASTLLGLGRVTSPPELDPLVRELAQQFLYSDEEDPQAQNAAFEAILPLATKWFTICFDQEIILEGQPIEFHSSLKDREVTMRLLTEEEADKVEFEWLATVRADGALVDVEFGGLTTF